MALACVSCDPMCCDGICVICCVTSSCWCIVHPTSYIIHHLCSVAGGGSSSGVTHGPPPGTRLVDSLSPTEMTELVNLLIHSCPADPHCRYRYRGQRGGRDVYVWMCMCMDI